MPWLRPKELVLTLLAGMALPVSSLWAATNCGPTTCYSLQGAPSSTITQISDNIDLRVNQIIATWYTGKKCDFNVPGSVTSLSPVACTNTLAGKSVGRICNLNAGEVSTNQASTSCGSGCSATLSCKKTFSYTDPLTGLSSSYDFAINDSPAQGCGLCQLDITPSSQAQWDGYKLGTLGGEGKLLLSKGIGTSSGASCGCCTVKINYASCEREASWIRGLLVDSAKKKLVQVKADLTLSPPIIQVPQGSSSRCAGMLSQLQTLKVDYSSQVGTASTSCTQSSVSDPAWTQKLQAAGLVQAPCLREAATTYINLATAYLAVCRVLEDAEAAYIQAQPLLQGVARNLDCSAAATMNDCVNTLDQHLKTVIQGLQP